MQLQLVFNTNQNVQYVVSHILVIEHSLLFDDIHLVSRNIQCHELSLVTFGPEHYRNRFIKFSRYSTT